MDFHSIVVKTVLYKSPFEKKLERAKKKALNKAGAIVRKFSRRSIRNRKKVSRPGEPPTNRTGRLKNSIVYALDDYGQSVIIGPKAFGTKKGAKTLEKGGTVSLPAQWQKKNFAPGLPGNLGGIGPVVVNAPPGPWTCKWNLDWNYHEFRGDSGRCVNVIWRRLRTEKEAELAERNYRTLQEMRCITPTTKKFGRVEPRPFMQPALVNAKKYVIAAWEKSLR